MSDGGDDTAGGRGRGRGVGTAGAPSLYLPSAYGTVDLRPQRPILPSSRDEIGEWAWIWYRGFGLEDLESGIWNLGTRIWGLESGQEDLANTLSLRGSNLAPTSSSREYDAPRGALRILNAGKVQSAFRSSGRVTSEDTGERRPRARPPKPEQAEAGPSKRKRDDGEGAGGDGAIGTGAKKSKGQGQGKGKHADALPRIMPNESLGAYNRRVEATLRGGVSQAIKSANAIRAAQDREAAEAKKKRIATAQGKAGAGTGTADGGGEGEGDDDGGANGKGKAKGKGKGNGNGNGDNNGEWKFEDRPVVVLPEKAAPRRLNDIAQAPPTLPKLKQNTKLGAWNTGGIGATGASVGKTDAGEESSRTPLNAGQRRLLEEERARVIDKYREMKVVKERARERERDMEARAMGKGKAKSDTGKKRKAVGADEGEE